MSDRVVPDKRTHRYISLLGTCAALSDDELQVVDVVAKALHRGQQEYGCLDIQTDARDFRAEAREEAIDGLIYRAIHHIRSGQ